MGQHSQKSEGWSPPWLSQPSTVSSNNLRIMLLQTMQALLWKPAVPLSQARSDSLPVGSDPEAVPGQAYGTGSRHDGSA